MSSPSSTEDSFEVPAALVPTISISNNTATNGSNRADDEIIGTTGATSYIGDYDSDDDLPPLLLSNSDDEINLVGHHRTWQPEAVAAVEMDDDERNRLTRNPVFHFFDGFGQSHRTVPFMGHTHNDIDRAFTFFYHMHSTNIHNFRYR